MCAWIVLGGAVTSNRASTSSRACMTTTESIPNWSSPRSGSSSSASTLSRRAMMVLSSARTASDSSSSPCREAGGEPAVEPGATSGSVQESPAIRR